MGGALGRLDRVEVGEAVKAEAAPLLSLGGGVGWGVALGVDEPPPPPPPLAEDMEALEVGDACAGEGEGEKLPPRGGSTPRAKKDAGVAVVVGWVPCGVAVWGGALVAAGEAEVVVVGMGEGGPEALLVAVLPGACSGGEGEGEGVPPPPRRGGGEALPLPLPVPPPPHTRSWEGVGRAELVPPLAPLTSPLVPGGALAVMEGVGVGGGEGDALVEVVPWKAAGLRGEGVALGCGLALA